MKVYYTDAFSGHYPIGTAAVVVAPNAEEAARLLGLHLDSIGLDQSTYPGPQDMKQAKTGKASVIIIRDGSY